MQIKSIQPMAAKILAEETGKMIIATKQLFYAMEVHKLLHFQNADHKQLPQYRLLQSG